MKHMFAKFHEKSMEDRKAAVFSFSQLNEEAKSLYCNAEYDQLSDQLVENAIGVMEIPLGVAVNFVVNQVERVIPMATEESSVIAAASHGAKLARPLGGFHAQVDGSYMFSQIHIIHLQDPYAAKVRILHHRDELIQLANQEDPILKQLGGGAYDITVRALEDPSSLVVHLHVDTLDAMGANAANTMAEKIAPRIEDITNGEARMKIISNLADRRIARAYCEVQQEQLGGADVVDRIVQACDIAKRDPYRAATHNKGIMNGITPIVLATGNDTRAVESGAHAYASKNQHYSPLTKWEKNSRGNLVGSIEVPIAVGTIGGATAIHPKAKSNLELMQINSAKELSEVIASVGLAQNLTALKALATEGIQKGHMKLHAKNIALMAGAKGDEIARIATLLLKDKKYRVDVAKHHLKTLRGEKAYE